MIEPWRDIENEGIIEVTEDIEIEEGNEIEGSESITDFDFATIASIFPIYFILFVN